MEITGVARSVPTGFETIPSAVIAAENREVLRAVHAVNAAELFGDQNQLRFQSDPQTHRMLIRLVNNETGEVVMQIPNEYLLRMAEELQKQSR
jgi:uncharacterized FlaG/YvyC family protein